MAQERYTNNATTTLNGSVNNSSDPVTVTVTSAVLFPSAGNFRIRIDDEILTVTAVSGSNFTATRAREGTSIATHANGADVKLVLTADALDQTIKDRVVVGALTNYAANNNIFHFGNDAGAGTINQLYAHTLPYIPIRTWDPDTYTWFAQGSSAYVKDSNFHSTFTVPYTSGEQLRGMHIATSGTTTIDAWFTASLCTAIGSGFHLCGVNIGNGSDDKKYRLAVMHHGTSYDSLIFQYFSSNTSAVTGIAQVAWAPRSPVCLRLAYNSGANNMIASFSIDGVNFTTLGTASSVSSNFTPNRAGVHFENNGISAIAGVYGVSNVYIR